MPPSCGIVLEVLPRLARLYVIKHHPEVDWNRGDIMAESTDTREFNNLQIDTPNLELLISESLSVACGSLYCDYVQWVTHMGLASFCLALAIQKLELT